jgi:regulatory protein
MSLYVKRYTPEVATTKIQQYCSYQERSHFEVKEKLYSYGLNKMEVENIIAKLIEANFLNEERFAIQFAGGKFRIKKWGKIKISYELKLKKVSIRNIQTALNEIDETSYKTTLQKLIQTKWNSLKNETELVKKLKTTKYLQQKGYEKNLILEIIAKICS